MNETKSLFFEKTKLTQLQLDSPKEKIQSEMKADDITEIQRIIRDFYEKLDANKIDNQKKKEQYLRNTQPIELTHWKRL